MTSSRIALIAVLSAAVSLATAAPTTDVRVLIDVSGSMKENDPANLRVPALQLLNGLMPAGAHGAIWMFAENVESRLAHGVVDDAWKRGAQEAANAVHWRGQRTDIEAALREATAGWQAADPDSRRSVILLTDGVVDTGSSAASAASRARILEQRVAALEASGAAVHAIALSPHADHDLLRSLAMRTGGWYERAEDAGQLERLFLRMFEKAAAPDTVPISGNRFSVDGSIDEMTVLVFRRPDGEKLQLMTPEGAVMSSSEPGDGVAWRAGNGYDMVTVRKPAPGQWEFNGEVDPDNRVMVITDLKLEVDGPPSYVLPGTALAVSAALTEAGERVTREDFLHLVGMNTRQQASDGESRDLVMLDDGDGGDVEAGDGRFGTMVHSGHDEGVVQITVTADSGTFVREKRFSLEVVWPASARIEAAAPPRLVVTPRPDVIDTATLAAEAQFVSGTNAPRALALVAGERGVLVAALDDDGDGGEVHVRIAATTPSGTALEMSLPTLEVAPATVPPVQTQPEPAAVVAPATPSDAEAATAVSIDAPPADWKQAALFALAANAGAAMLLGGLLWWLARRQRTRLAACEAALSPSG